MKKIYLILFFYAVCFCLYAQNPRLSSSSVSYIYKDFNSNDLGIFSSYSDGYVGLLTTCLNKKCLNKNNQNTCLIQINDNVTKMNEKWFTIPTEMDNIVKIFDCNSSFIGFYEKYDKNSKIESIYRQVISKDGTSQSKLENVFSVELEKRDNTVTYFASSEDKSKHAALFMFTNKKDKLMGLYTILMNEDGDILWQDNFNPSFKYQYFDVQSIILSNDGNIVLSLNNYDKKGTGIVNEQVVILQMKEGQMEKNEISSPYTNITSMEALFMDNEHIMIAGYYTNEKRKNSSCIFSINFDLETATFGKFHDVDLSAKLASRLTFFKARGSSFQIYTKGLEKLDNGQLVLLGEQRLLIVNIDVKTGQRTYSYHNGNILASYLNSEGEILNNTTIEKYQIANTNGGKIISGFIWTPVSAAQKDPYYMGLSYNYFKQGNNIYCVYNDLAKNYLPGASGVKPYLGIYKTSGTVLAKITPDLKINKYLINNYKETKTVFKSLPYFNDNNNTAILLFYSFAKKTECVYKKLEIK